MRNFDFRTEWKESFLTILTSIAYLFYFLTVAEIESLFLPHPILWSSIPAFLQDGMGEKEKARWRFMTNGAPHTTPARSPALLRKA